MHGKEKSRTMPTTRVTRPVLLATLRDHAGELATATAEALLDFAGQIGAEEEARQNSISVRLRGPVGSEQKWLTLFLISVAGTFYTGWLNRWAKAGAPKDVAVTYQTRLTELLGPVVYYPTQYAKAPSLSTVAKHLDDVKSAIRAAAASLRNVSARG